MRLVNLPRIARNLLHVAMNLSTKQGRRLRQQWRRASKAAREQGKQARADVRQHIGAARESGSGGYRRAVRLVRYGSRLQQQVWPRVRRDVAVRSELRRLARSRGPILVGPWLSEVGYEVLYWVPFLRWAQDRYRLDPERLVVVSRGGAAVWYEGVARRSVELLDLFTPAEFASINAARHAAGDQKQSASSEFDRQILDRVRAGAGLSNAEVLHPSLMFSLLRQFWLGNESLEYLLDHLQFAAPMLPPIAVPELPERFIAVKFYSGVAVPRTAAYRQALRGLVARLAEEAPVVTLETAMALDEHEDYRFVDVPGVVSIADGLSPQQNLAVQTEVIRRSIRFAGTCGGLAWLAPMLGVPTVGVYADEAFLSPHLYAARYAYRTMAAGPFTTLDLNALALIRAGAGNSSLLADKSV